MNFVKYSVHESHDDCVNNILGSFVIGYAKDHE